MKSRSVSIGPDGYLRVPLGRSGQHEAIIALDDYQQLIELGVSPNWQRCGGSVSAVTKKGNMLVGRILADARAGQRVHYKDGNPLNLRRDNLSVREGGFSVVNNKEALEAVA
jgi:hypothetical protein